MRTIKWDFKQRREMVLRMEEADKFLKALERIDVLEVKGGAFVNGSAEDIDFIMDFFSRIQLPGKEVNYHDNA